MLGGESTPGNTPDNDKVQLLDNSFDISVHTQMKPQDASFDISVRAGNDNQNDSFSITRKSDGANDMGDASFDISVRRPAEDEQSFDISVRPVEDSFDISMRKSKRDGTFNVGVKDKPDKSFDLSEIRPAIVAQNDSEFDISHRSFKGDARQMFPQLQQVASA